MGPQLLGVEKLVHVSDGRWGSVGGREGGMDGGREGGN